MAGAGAGDLDDFLPNTSRVDVARFLALGWIGLVVCNDNSEIVKSLNFLVTWKREE